MMLLPTQLIAMADERCLIFSNSVSSAIENRQSSIGTKWNKYVVYGSTGGKPDLPVQPMYFWWVDWYNGKWKPQQDMRWKIPYHLRCCTDHLLQSPNSIANQSAICHHLGFLLWLDHNRFDFSNTYISFWLLLFFPPEIFIR